MNTRERKRLPRDDPKRYDYMYARPNKYGRGFDAMGVICNGYGRSSVLAGQDMICFVESFPTLEALDKKYPGLGENVHGRWTEPRNSFDHLPGDDDPDPYGDNAAAAADY